MLGKLLKYDLRGVSRLMVPATLLVLGTTLLGTVSLRFAGQNINIFPQGTLAADIFASVLYLIFGMSVFALIAYAAASFIMVLVHYYRNFYTSEGYLTFTLPVSTSSLISSKMLSSSIWMIFAALVVILCICIYMLFGTTGAGFVNTEFFRDIGLMVKDLWQSMNPMDFVFFVVEVLLVILSTVFYSILQAFLAITIGCIIAKKHKILASVGFYYIINMIVSTVSTVVMFVFFTGSTVLTEVYTFSVISGTAGDSYMGYMHAYMITTLILYAGLAVAEYFVNRHLIRHKLNI